MYFPPHPSISNRKIEQFFDLMINTFLIGSNFNTKHQQWGCISENSRSELFKNLIVNRKYTVQIRRYGPIYWPTHHNKHPDILNFFISNFPNLNYVTLNLNDPVSDHIPVILNIEGTPTYSFFRPSSSQGSINWCFFFKAHENLNKS